MKPNPGKGVLSIPRSGTAGGYGVVRGIWPGLTLTGMNLAAKRPLAGIPVGGPGGYSPLMIWAPTVAADCTDRAPSGVHGASLGRLGDWDQRSQRHPCP